MSSNAFKPQGNSVAINGTSTASTGVQCTGGSSAGDNNATQRLVDNGRSGAKDCWLAWGAANVAAVAPADGAPANGILIPAGAIMVLSFPPNAYFSIITNSTDTTTLFLTPGEGV